MSAPTDLYHPHSLGREPGYPILARSFVVVLEFLGVHSGRYQNGGSKKQKKKKKKKREAHCSAFSAFSFSSCSACWCFRNARSRWPGNQVGKPGGKPGGKPSAYSGRGGCSSVYRTLSQNGTLQGGCRGAKAATAEASTRRRQATRGPLPDIVSAGAPHDYAMGLWFTGAFTRELCVTARYSPPSSGNIKMDLGCFDDGDGRRCAILRGILGFFAPLGAINMLMDDTE